MISINGKTPTTTEICNYNLTRKNEGNTGYAVVWSQHDFQPYDLVEITQDETHQFVIDKVRELSKSNDEKKQEIQLQDTIHYFDKVTPPSRQFTTNKTVEEVLDIYAVDEKNNPIFNYTNSYLLDAIMPQKEYDGENLSTILKDLGKRVNAKVDVEIRDSQPPLLTFTPLAQRVGTTAIDNSKAEHYQTEYESANYATQVLGKVKNAIVEDGRGTWFPSKIGFVFPRTDEFRFDEANAAYIFNDKIWALINAYVVLKVSNDGGATFEFPEVEIKDWIYSKEYWDFLDNPTNANFDDATIKNQANTIYYRIGGDRVENLWATHPSLTNDREHLFNVIKSVVKKYELDNPTYVVSLDTFNGVLGYGIKFKYVSQRDVDYVVEKMSVDNKYQATLLSNQLSTLVELNQHASAMSLLAERIANKEITYKETTSGTLVKLGNWTTDNRIVTTVKREVNGSETRQTIELSKNFANIDVETSVSRSPDPFQITNKQIKTNFLTKEYLEFSTSPKAIDSYMDATARRIAVNIFNYDITYDNPIFDGQIIPTIPSFIGGVYDGKAIHVPAMTFADNTIGFHVHLFHPTFAGYTLNNDDERGVIEYKREINGEIQDLATYDMQFGTENVIDDTDTNRLYPLVTETVGTIDIGTIYANLDPNCLLAHTHNIQVVTDSPDEIILNGNFGFYNNLIRELNNPSLEVYVSQDIYNVFTTADKKVRLNDIPYTSGTISFNHTLRELTVTHPNTVDNIAIVLGDDIILALNGIDTCYVNYGKNRTGLKGLVYYSGTSFGSFGFTGTASGSITAKEFSGTSSGVISFTGTASGSLSFIEYDGTSNGTFGFIGTADGNYSGSATYDGTASGTIGFVGTANGSITIENHDGTANGNFSFNGTANGSFLPNSREYTGTANGTIGFTGSSSGAYTYQVWDFIGTSAPPQDGLTDLGTSGTASCRTSTEAGEDLQQTVPASERSVSFIMKVEHDYEDPTFGTVSCTPFYYRNIEVTE